MFRRSRRAQSEAHAQVTGLTDRLTAAGLAAAAAVPGVAAQIDQHAAAVRDILTHGVSDAHEVPSVVLLAGYAEGVLDGADPHWTLPEQIDWPHADWTMLRLAAVAQLATPDLVND